MRISYARPDMPKKIYDLAYRTETQGTLLLYICILRSVCTHTEQMCTLVVHVSITRFCVRLL